MEIQIKNIVGEIIFEGSSMIIKEAVEKNYANLVNADLRGANLGYSVWPLRCSSLSVKIGQILTVQLLYHAVMPHQHHVTDLDADLTELLNSELFKKCVNKFHRVAECGKFAGTKKSESENA